MLFRSKLVNQQTFLVTVTRLRDSLTLIVDNADKLQAKLARNPGGKTSALETSGQLRSAPGRDGSGTSVTSPERSLDLEPGRGVLGVRDEVELEDGLLRQPHVHRVGQQELAVRTEPQPGVVPRIVVGGEQVLQVRQQEIGRAHV